RMNLNDDVVYRCLRLGPVHQLHPGRSRGLLRYNDRLHGNDLLGCLSLTWKRCRRRARAGYQQNARQPGTSCFVSWVCAGCIDRRPKPDGSGSLRWPVSADRCAAPGHKTVPRLSTLTVPSAMSRLITSVIRLFAGDIVLQLTSAPTVPIV